MLIKVKLNVRTFPSKHIDVKVLYNKKSFKTLCLSARDLSSLALCIYANFDQDRDMRFIQGISNEHADCVVLSCSE